jgi:hypothetical protein
MAPDNHLRVGFSRESCKLNGSTVINIPWKFSVAFQGKSLPSNVPVVDNAGMNRCDWADCIEIGIFDGVTNSLLNVDGRKHVVIDETPAKFIFLCPKHFELGVGNLKLNED